MNMSIMQLFKNSGGEKLLDSYQNNKNDLEKALLQSLEGIRKDLNLNQTEFAQILHLGISTYNGWLKNGKVKLSNQKSADDLALFNFIDLYDAITSIYQKKKDYLNWFKSKLTEDKSPIEMMIMSPERVFQLNKYANWLINP